MCWKIVRISGDGSIKLILEDIDYDCTKSMGDWSIPTETGGTNFKGNFGYTSYAANTLTASDGTQNSDEKYIMNYLNGGTENNESMAYAFENFQGDETKVEGTLAQKIYKNHNGKTINDYLKAGDWCLNDKAYASKNDNTTPLTKQEILDKQIKEETFYYDSYVRLNGKTTKEPTLKCNGTNMSKFADNTDMYVGTLTADEIVYAGCSGFGKIGSKIYNYLINDSQKTYNLEFWSLSPLSFGFNYEFAIAVNNGGRFSENANDVGKTLDLRPAVQLKSGIQISSGNGTKDNPYIIQ